MACIFALTSQSKTHILSTKKVLAQKKLTPDLRAVKIKYYYSLRL